MTGKSVEATETIGNLVQKRSTIRCRDVADPKGVCKPEKRKQRIADQGHRKNFLDIEDTDSGEGEVESIGQCRNFVE